MNSEADSYFVAEFTVGSNKGKVELSEITMDSCIARVNFMVRPYQQGMLQIHTYQKGSQISSFSPAKVMIESVRQKTGQVGSAYLKLRFLSMVTASQGIVQLLHSIIYAPSEMEEPVEEASNNAIRVEMVSCPICNQKNIAFRTLEKRTMVTETNIFGVPRYLEASPGHVFCDFNLIRIIVCPSCFFASNDVNEFIRKPSEGKETKNYSNVRAISNQWLDSVNEREKLLDRNLDHFFDEERSHKQAILSYQLAVSASDRVFKLDEKVSSRKRNYNPARKSLYYLFVKAELLMSNAHAPESENILREIIRRLEVLFPMLSRESSIRSAYLLGMLNIYFENFKQAAKYLTFLSEYNKRDTVKYGTKEYTELATNLKKLNQAMQNREDFSRDNLSGFRRPYY